MHYPCRHGRFCLEAAKCHISFPVVFIPDLVLGCGVEWAGAGGWAFVAAGIKVVVLLPET